MSGVPRPASRSHRSVSAHDSDVVVVGAGLVGLASALQLLRRDPALDVIVVEAEQEVATHQSGHNSGVVHAGVYYQPGSLKARLCREGRQELIDFARDHAIPFRQDGKLIVAARPSEHRRLDDLYDRARANGLRGVRLLSGPELREIEPHVGGQRAARARERRDRLRPGGARLPAGARAPGRTVAGGVAGDLRPAHGRRLGARVRRARAAGPHGALLRRPVLRPAAGDDRSPPGPAAPPRSCRSEATTTGCSTTQATSSTP